MGIENIKVKPSDAIWGNQELSKVTCVADVADSLDGTYFTFDTPSTAYYVWFDGVVASDPAPAGRTAIAVAYSTGATAATLAGLVVTAVDGAGADVHAKINPDDNTSVMILNAVAGAVTATADVDAGVTVAQEQVGSSDDLGKLDGDIEVSLEEQATDITAHQHGTEPMGAIRTGTNVEITLNLKETTVADLEKIFNAGGESLTPGGGTEVYGWGESRQFTAFSGQWRKLVLHPVSNTSTDYSEDFAALAAYPMPGSITISGENPMVVAVTFRCFINEAFDKKISKFLRGDHTQNLLR